MKKSNLLSIVILATIMILGCTPLNKNKEYFYYYNNEKIFLNLVGNCKNSEVHEKTLLEMGKECNAKINLVFTPISDPSVEMILTDEFIVKLKQGVEAKQLDLLNQKYKVQNVRNIYGSNDEFILKVTPASKMNSLDMANTYHGESIIQWSEPDWIQKLDFGPER